MTTKIRIENAQSHGGIYVMVQEQNVNAEGQWVNSGEAYPLMHPAQMFETVIHQNKRYIVSELQLGNA